jgi:hypothetical protein
MAPMVETLAAQLRPGDHVLVMSNGGFGGVHAKLLERLARAARGRMKSEQDELQLLLRSRFPIIVVETAEERRFLQARRERRQPRRGAALHLERGEGPAGSTVGSASANTRELIDAHRAPSSARRRTASTCSSTRAVPRPPGGDPHDPRDRLRAREHRADARASSGSRVELHPTCSA